MRSAVLPTRDLESQARDSAENHSRDVLKTSCAPQWGIIRMIPHWDGAGASQSNSFWS